MILTKSKVPLKAQYKICYSYIREIAAIGEHLHYDEHCTSAKINGILKARYAALKWHIELHFHPMLIQACETHYSQSKQTLDKYHGGAWMDKHREADNSHATFTRNNKISRYQRGVYSRMFDDIPF